MKTNSSQLNKQQDGFVLLFTIVVTAIIFFIGAGIYSLSFKELMVSSLSKESQKSIFAADSGVECALWANINNVPPFESFPCMGYSTRSFGQDGLSFYAQFDNKLCARVLVQQVTTLDPSDLDAAGTTSTKVISQGYNKCNDFYPVPNYAGLAERVYKVSY
jgi:hypothetical protein